MGTFATYAGRFWPGGKSRIVTLALGSLDMARQTTRPPTSSIRSARVRLAVDVGYAVIASA